MYVRIVSVFIKHIKVLNYSPSLASSSSISCSRAAHSATCSAQHVPLPSRHIATPHLMHLYDVRGDLVPLLPFFRISFRPCRPQYLHRFCAVYLEPILLSVFDDLMARFPMFTCTQEEPPPELEGESSSVWIGDSWGSRLRV
jgi:hypothetical protein